MHPTSRVKPNDLFNFQGLRKRVFIVPDYSSNDERLQVKHSENEDEHIDDEYHDLDSIEQQFDAYVRPKVDRAQWIVDRQHQREEIDRLGDLVTFYEHKPKLTEFEKRIYKRMTRKDRCIQTDPEPDQDLRQAENRKRIPIIRLPEPLALERVEDFLVENHWRLLDLFRALDRDKSWTVVKEDFRHLIEQEHLNISEAQAEELIMYFCREVGVPLDYKRFARGRATYKKNLRESARKTPSSMDTQLASDPSSSSSCSNYLQIPPPDVSHQYPKRESPLSQSQSSVFSARKYKRSTPSTERSGSKFSTYQ